MSDVDVSCYGCGTPTRLDLPMGDIPYARGRCAYCGADVFFFTLASQRHRRRELDDGYWERLSDDSEATDEGPQVVNGVPVNFRLLFDGSELVGPIDDETPHLDAFGGQQRHSRRLSAIAARYVERLHAELDPLAPTVEIRPHISAPDEVGGPGLVGDFIELVIAGAVLAAGYPGLKEIIRDVRAVAAGLQAKTHSEIRIDTGIAWLYAIDEIGNRFGVTDMTLVASIPLVQHVEDWDVTRGFQVTIAAGSTTYVVTLEVDGTVNSTASMATPVLREAVPGEGTQVQREDPGGLG